MLSLFESVRLLTFYPRGVVTSYSYDSLARPLGISYSVLQGSTTSAMPNVCTPTGGSANSANVSYYYDQGSNSLAQTQKGYRTSMSDVSGSSAWTYDMMGNVLTQQKTVGTITKNISQTYALDGSLSSIVYPSGYTIAYTIGNAQRATSVQIPNDVSFVSAGG